MQWSMMDLLINIGIERMNNGAFVVNISKGDGGERICTLQLRAGFPTYEEAERHAVAQVKKMMRAMNKQGQVIGKKEAKCK